jgi:hypothetical protein
MAHLVKCTICGKQFDRDKIQAVKSGARRYAHQTCFPEGELVPLPNPIDEDQLKLEEYIIQLLGNNYNPARVKKQIKEYREMYNYSYTGMLKTLIWFYEIKGNSKDKANGGIGIIPFVYQDASNYYYSMYLAKIANQDKDVSQYKLNTKEIEIESPRTYLKPPRLFKLEEEDFE